MIKLSALFAILVAPAFASCPDPTRQEGAVYNATGAELLAPRTFAVTAGGGLPVPCVDFVDADPSLLREELVGFMSGEPTAVIELEGMAPHILTVSARAECGPVLTVHASDGQWYFGEFSDAGQAVTLWGAPDGPLRVWVGSTTLAQCEGAFTLETFDR
ncbi:hypothetical protein L0664_14175 [Octadecabacter sp. G9-8]|uniref:Lipoprotein n=1 Tax=Octadecabacter dasysiphoniae TaxID=2909341 RepID=A0ABS9CYJ0_9RHOB|nr:hypothetical protein [Octadecabacter dasysiphoniae]MCF2872218.1 hypothetical protein [Octadecabacter dasysiphoniae]